MGSEGSLGITGIKGNNRNRGGITGIMGITGVKVNHRDLGES